MSKRNDHAETIIQSIFALKRSLMSKSVSKKQKLTAITHAQWAVLGALMETEKMTLKEIAKILHVSSSAATQLVDSLVDHGYLVRVTHPTDRRAFHVSIAPKYKKQMREMKTKAIDQFKTVFDVLSDAEIAAFAKLHKKIIEHIQK